MSRYIRSFLITFIIYMSVLSLILYLSIDKKSVSKKPNQQTSRVSFCVRQEQVSEPNVVSQSKQKIQKDTLQQVTQHKLEKTQTSQPPILQTVVELPKQAVFEKQKEEIKEIKPPRKIPESTIKPTTQTVAKKTEDDGLKMKQTKFITELISRINSNKSYPRMARKEGIEGDVKIEFLVYSDGNVDNLKLICGEKIFEKSAIEAIKKSFPIQVDQTLFHFPKEFTITIAYALNK